MASARLIAETVSATMSRAMAETTSQRILVGFQSQKDLQQAQRSLQDKSLPSASVSVIPPASENVPEKRVVKPSAVKTALQGGVTGAIASGTIALFARNIPNLASVYNNSTPLTVLAILIGTAFGAGGSFLMSFFAGAKQNQKQTDYQLVVEASDEDIKVITPTLLEKGGRLL